MTGQRADASTAPGGRRLVLLTTSPRVAPGLLTRQAWALLGESRVHAGSAAHPQLPHLEAAGIDVRVEPNAEPAAVAQRLTALAQVQTVVWLLAPGDDLLEPALAAALARVTDPPEIEVVVGSFDLPGARVLDLVALMDRLRSAGGCPWDARQTHESLVTYLVEETYETVEAIENGDLAHLREELGDLLLQVVFHARIAQEHDEAPWSIDDVAMAIVDKLVRRHPHVFGDRHGGTNDVQSADDLETTWEQLKSAEKGRTSATDGVPLGLPALSLATKLISRAARSGLAVPVPRDASLGGRLLGLAAEAQGVGLDPESELRRAVRAYVEAIRRAEEAGGQTEEAGGQRGAR